ncbi:hypothetical protein [Polyangium spumosum]|uniref:DUF5666 domain-containing protein n=1 Tax=Polyangium spumosum TaxID=889282 RepID=A0A6N7Q6E9_9BACT|nr:hypothetical protein [Polyangium spumosum]MRG97874.1 hypothetical protein [Polyangium spumosum]
MNIRSITGLLLLSCSLVACGGEPDPPPGSGGAGGMGGGAGGMGGAGGAGGMGGVGGMGGSGGMSDARVVVGVIQAPNELVWQAASVHVVVKVDGVVVRDATIGTGVPAPIVFPQEFELEGLADGALVEVSVETDFDGTGQDVHPRLASTRAKAGKTPLLRVTLSHQGCGAGCGAGLTCNWGRCLDPHLAPEVLEAYSSDWAKYSWCKPKDAGAPTLMLGQGDAMWSPLSDQDTLHVWPGDQGGHHIFAALRTRNLKQMAVVKVSGMLSDTGEVLGPVQSMRVFPDRPAQGFCEATGILFQIDTKLPMAELVGRQVHLKAEVSDADGAAVVEQKTVVIGSP